VPKKVISPSLAVKRSLRQSGIKAKKGLGQHFLVDQTVLETIVSAAELSKKDLIIEVGPGLGILTSELARRAGNVVAVELDAKLASELKQKLSSLSNVTIINADILEVDLSDLIGMEGPYKVVANIPYYITSPILHYFIEASPKPSLMVVMVQKEVGEAIVAEPGEMTVLAVSIQVYSKPRIISYVSSQSFYPPPKVDSAIVRFDMLPEPAVKLADIDNFVAFVRCGFRSPRKQLRNSLAQGLNMKPAEIIPILTEAKIEPQRRPETLNLAEWQRLYEVAIISRKVEMPC
jgi:16S rRNA (adenine1518-N6/adenine1519-N6)-dimethyltransferase